MGEDVAIEFLCCLCGYGRGDEDAITLTASWDEAGEERWQAWGAHRSCFIERMSDEARSFGGPLLGD